MMSRMANQLLVHRPDVHEPDARLEFIDEPVNIMRKSCFDLKAFSEVVVEQFFAVDEDQLVVLLHVERKPRVVASLYDLGQVVVQVLVKLQISVSPLEAIKYGLEVVLNTYNFKR